MTILLIITISDKNISQFSFFSKKYFAKESVFKFLNFPLFKNLKLIEFLFHKNFYFAKSFKEKIHPLKKIYTQGFFYVLVHRLGAPLSYKFVFSRHFQPSLNDFVLTCHVLLYKFCLTTPKIFYYLIIFFVIYFLI